MANVRNVAIATGVDPVSPSHLATKNYVDLSALASSWPPVAARTTSNPNPGSGNAGLIQSLCRVGRTVHRVASSGASQIRLEYGNWYTQQSQPGEVAGPNSVSYRAAIEYPAGVWSPTAGSTAWSASTVYFAPAQVTYGGVTYVARQQTTAGHVPSSYIGVEWDVVTRYLVHWTGEDANRRLTVAGGGNAVSLPVALTTPLRAGTLIAVTTEASTGATTQYIPPGDLAFTSSPGWDFALNYTTLPTPGSATDPVDSGITTQTTLGNSTAIPMPLAITGHAPSNDATLVLGDSILAGTGDNYVDSYVPGWAMRAIGSASWWRVAKTGDEASDFLSSYAQRMAIAGRCTRAIVDYGTNEIRDGVALATVQANLVSVWSLLAAAGLTVYQSTITPQTTSTDSWATTANQTAAAGFGASSVWASLNSWLRGGAAWYFGGTQLTAGQLGHPLTGVVDVAATVTDATTGWAWKPANTSDGIHPNATGHAAMASVATPLLASSTSRLATLEALLASNPTETQHYGDVVSSCRRPAVTSNSTLSNGYWTSSMFISPKTFTATKVRFYVSTAGVAGASPTFSLGIYGAAAWPLSLLATAPVTSATLTSTGIKELTLSAPITVVAGNRYAWLTYVAPSSYTTTPSVGCTATYYNALNNPSPSSTYQAYKSASTAPGSTLNVSDGTWTGDVATIWWALL